MASTPEKPSTSGPHLLVVEHHPANRRLFEVVLRDVVGKVSLVATHEEAEQILGQEAIDIMIIEPQEPGGLSWELLDKASRTIPTIVVTSRTEKSLGIAMLDRGAVAFLPKPFERADLVEAVRRALAL